MIYIFGSLHYDPDETYELEKMLYGAKRNIIVAIELSSNSHTRSALKKIRSISDLKITEILKYHFGNRRIIATSKFLKILRKSKKVEMVIPIEPKSSKKYAKLNVNAWRISYGRYSSYYKYLQNHQKEKNGINKLLSLYKTYNLNVAAQCFFREKYMVKSIVRLAKNNPRKDIFVYCGFLHAVYIKEHLRMPFIERKNSSIAKLEHYDPIILGIKRLEKYGMAKSKKMKFNNSEFIKQMVLDKVVEKNPRDIDINEYFKIYNEIGRRLKFNPPFKLLFD